MDRPDRYRADPGHFRPEVQLLNRVDPLKSIGKRLLASEKPARYLGGEQGSILKEGDLFTVALCFPDLYEIGMSNNAIRILYSGLNSIPGVRCERVFAPAPDFEAVLRETGTPLYTLESGIPLQDADIVAFSVGYELCATNILTVLDLGRIPLDSESRSSQDPLVLAGGPAVTNPHPLARFLDAVWIGEAEDRFFLLIQELALMKQKGAKRNDFLERFKSEEAFWMKDKPARRAVDMDFPDRAYDIRFPWPSIKPVQDHGTVEIMRGCPNGCRFCHAGYFYRPQRVRSPDRIFQEVEDLIVKSGYREITLASLSSGDYPELPSLIRELNRIWSGRKISFQLPSLKIESFTLPVIAELARTRKSGLTFAVETPLESWQRSINKIASLEKILTILSEAEAQGYRLAKFYFMIGLPFHGSGNTEAEHFIGFLDQLLRSTRFQLNINIGTFIPKPHTPFQWCAQLGEEEALSAIQKIRGAFRGDRRLKISYHTPFISILESILSRGDERVGDIVLNAWRMGSRLDAWEDLLNKDAWRSAMDQAPPGLIPDILGEKTLDASLPWDDVSLRIGRNFLKKEFERARAMTQSPICDEECANPCGVCAPDGPRIQKKIHSIKRYKTVPSNIRPAESKPSGPNEIFRLVFRFEKKAASAFLPHHSILEHLYRALQLTDIPVQFSEGFNPLPRLEIEDPLPLGMESLEDYFSILLLKEIDIENVIVQFNSLMPVGIRILEARLFSIHTGMKGHSLSGLYWGSDYFFGSGRSSIQGISSVFFDDPRLLGSYISSFEHSPDSFLLRLKAGGSREIGFNTLFLKSFGSSFPDSPISVIRQAQWAAWEGKPFPYFQVLENLHGTAIQASIAE